jgi:RNA polymerase sigma-70 factor (ECF subfamily)
MDTHRTHSDLARVYEEHVWRVYGFLAYRLRDPATAEDLTQVTFERAIRAFSRFDPRRASERTWLLAIARNALIDYQRRGSKITCEPLDERVLPLTAGPEEALLAGADLHDALATLSERDREVLALRYGGDMTGPEIAELLDLGAANVHQILSRSLRKLREVLDPAAGEATSSGTDPRPA